MVPLGQCKLLSVIGALGSVAAFKQRNSTLAPKGRMGWSVARSSVMEASSDGLALQSF